MLPHQLIMVIMSPSHGDSHDLNGHIIVTIKRVCTIQSRVGMELTYISVNGTYPS